MYLLQEMYGKLRSFASSVDNHSVDISFVIFNGHGYSEGSNTFLIASDGPFEVWSNCSRIFTNQNSHIGDKPKICLVQLCRGNGRMRSLRGRPFDSWRGGGAIVFVKQKFVQLLVGKK